MAEYGLHHAVTNFGDTKPSIFEVIGQANLASSLRAAFRHLFKVLAESNPVRYSLLYRNFDEAYTVVDSVLQYIHLRLKGGLFPETFYNLKRIPDPRSLDTSKRKILAWIFLAVIFPYLQTQMENAYKNLREDYHRGNLQYKDFKKQLVLLYLKLYPYYNFFWEITILAYYMTFALGKSKYHSPMMHLTSTTLTHLTLEDMSEDAWKNKIPKSLHKNFSNTIWNYLNLFIGGFTLTISVGSFLTQFLNWWYTREGGVMNFAPLPVPPPPMKWPHVMDVEICSICKKERSNDTALASSGFVFCYPCIYQYVEKNKKCPVTGYRSSLAQLIKLYHH